MSIVLQAKVAQSIVELHHLAVYWSNKNSSCIMNDTLTLWVELLNQYFDYCSIIDSNTLAGNPVYTG